MAVGLVRTLAVLAILVLAVPVSAGTPTDPCASVTTDSSSRTDATASTQSGYSVSVSGGGQTVKVHALGNGCVGEVMAKSSKLVFKTIAAILDEVPPLP